MEQGTEEWFAARLGKVTASRISDVMAKTKSGPSASRRNYMMQLLCERLTGEREESYTNAAMQRGVDLEPLARARYEIEIDSIVEEVALIDHPTIFMSAASPDGLVGEAGMLEIKCPNTAQHVACIETGKADPKYIKQMNWQMACANRLWCAFVSFDDRMPEELQFFCVEVERDDELIKEMESEVVKFLEELDALELRMNERRMA